MTIIAVTGCHGFIGGALLSTLQDRGIVVKRVERSLLAESARQELAHHIADVSAVIHCAGLTPRRGRRVSDEQFDLGNRQLTRNLGLAAADAKVRRLVFVSSIAAVGGNSGILSPAMPHRPTSAYGRSKADAEVELLAIEGLQSIIVRPPLVYGPGPKGDLSLLVRLCASPLPLPFGAVDNRRSMIGVTNLVDALCFLATMEWIGTASQVFHASDGTPFSLRELVAMIRRCFDRPPNLVNVPPALLEALFRVAGLRSLSQKLLGDLQIDISTLRALGWRPPVGPEHDLKRMTQALISNKDK